MRKCLLFALIVCFVLIVSSQAHAWEISIDDYMAGATYEEKGSLSGLDIKSDWKSFYNKTAFYLGDYDNKNIEGEVNFGMFLTPKARETWNINGSQYQTNDMSLWGMSTSADIGWAFSMNMGEKSNITATPLIGYRWKFIRFSRSNFNILNAITIAETVDEDYDLHFLDIGGRFNYTVGKFEVFTKPIFGIVLYDAAKNSVLGTIKGGGGFLFNIDAGVNYSMTENLILGLMFTAEIQDLKGGETSSVIWPDNTLNTFGGTVRLKYKF